MRRTWQEYLAEIDCAEETHTEDCAELLVGVLAKKISTSEK